MPRRRTVVLAEDPSTSRRRQEVPLHSIRRLPRRTLLVAALLALLAIPAGAGIMSPSTASACPIQGCHVPPDPPPPSPPPGPAKPKYRIFIDLLIAYQTEDSFEDEAYINVNGSRVWGPHSINALQAQHPNVSVDVTGGMWVTLYDDDWPDSDDWLGDDVPSLPSAVGAMTYDSLRFTHDGADYLMPVRVLRLS
jgi:hypothetical protein